MKQTAVEWLIGELMEKDLLLVFGKPSLDNDAIKIIEQAKAMEKEQIIDARVDGDTWSTAIKEMRTEYAEQYYNETFNTNEKP
jgi:hypothetical protein